MIRVVAIVATCALAGCPSRGPKAAQIVDDSGLRVQIAQDEAKRGGGVAELEELARGKDAHARELALRGLGRIGGDEARRFLVEQHADRELEIAKLLDDPPAKQPYPAEQRAKLVAETRDTNPDARLVAVRRLGREPNPPADPAVVAALVDRVSDESAEVRAAAIAALAKRKAIVGIERALDDRDWRVRVEAVRALAGPAGDEAGRQLVVGKLAAWALDARDPGVAQVLIDALRVLLPHGTALPNLATGGIPPLTHGWIRCLAVAVQRDSFAGCTDKDLPDHLRLPLLGELVKAHAFDVAWRREAMRELLGNADPRVRAAGLDALAATWPDGDDRDHAAIVDTLAAALGSKDLAIAGAAADAAPAIYEHLGDAPEAKTLDAALVARAGYEGDPELAVSLLELIGQRKLAAGAESCRNAHDRHPLRAKAGAACLAALGEPTAAPPPEMFTLAPVDVAGVIGHKITWHLTTTRGAITIDLRPDVAPWAVATLVHLTRIHFYDHTEFHRVVPGFVVQGGDPTATGAGGPGFTIPAEPTLDPPGFVAGAVGIADAGRDSGGSQFFIMHARAPHLDGRYTWVGQVADPASLNVANALLIGDQITAATVEVR